MGNKVLLSLGVLAGAFVLQVGVAPYISIAGATPNFFMIAAVAIALISGPNDGAAVGFVGGLLYDMVGMTAVGPMALVLAAAGYVAGLLQQNMFSQGWGLPLTTLGVVSLASEVTYLLVISLLGVDIEFWRTLVTLTAPSAVYTIGVGLLLYPPLSKMMGRRRPVTSIKRLG